MSHKKLRRPEHTEIINKVTLIGCGLLLLFLFQLPHFVVSTLSFFHPPVPPPQPEPVKPYVYTAEMKYSGPVATDTPQFVVLSFDGSKSVEMLDETRDFVKKMNAENKPMHFTYFLNAAYFYTKDEATKIYQGPHRQPGASDIGFAENAESIPHRIQSFNEAVKEGNEIGSHTVGHFNGANWTEEDWNSEFSQFDKLLAGLDGFKPGTITGFRAPYLGYNKAMFKALKDSHLTYDTSVIMRGNEWPKKDENGIWLMPMPGIWLPHQKRPTIAMDYSIRQVQSDGQDIAKKGTELWNEYFQDLKEAYMNYFNANFSTNRAPVFIADHFPKMNDGVYWEAMKDFAENVCGRPNVRCVTFSQLVDYLNNVGVPGVAPTVMTATASATSTTAAVVNHN